jgi:hypothetical protein
MGYRISSKRKVYKYVSWAVTVVVCIYAVVAFIIISKCIQCRSTDVYTYNFTAYCKCNSLTLVHTIVTLAAVFMMLLLGSIDVCSKEKVEVKPILKKSSSNYLVASSEMKSLNILVDAAKLTNLELLLRYSLRGSICLVYILVWCMTLIFIGAGLLGRPMLATLFNLERPPNYGLVVAAFLLMVVSIFILNDFYFEITQLSYEQSEDSKGDRKSLAVVSMKYDGMSKLKQLIQVYNNFENLFYIYFGVDGVYLSGRLFLSELVEHALQFTSLIGSLTLYPSKIVFVGLCIILTSLGITPALLTSQTSLVRREAVILLDLITDSIFIFFVFVTSR